MRETNVAQKKKAPKKRPIDLNQLAASIVGDATGEEDEDAAEAEGDEKAGPEKDPAAVALGRKGGLKGGKARAASLSARKRSQIAKKAAKARWAKPEP